MNPKSLLKIAVFSLVLAAAAPGTRAAEPSPLATLVEAWRGMLADLKTVAPAFDRINGHADYSRRVFAAMNRRQDAERELNPPIPRHWFRIVGRPYRRLPLERVAD